MELTHDDVRRILEIIDASSCEELHLELGDLKLIVRKRVPATNSPGRPVAHVEAGAAAPLAEENAPGAQAAAPADSGGRERASRASGVELKAPMIGTFYRAPAPGAPPFVEVGSMVTEDDIVCIIEVMKLMHSIKAGCRGRVVEIWAENGGLVEFGQTLMVIEPSP